MKVDNRATCWGLRCDLGLGKLRELASGVSSRVTTEYLAILAKRTWQAKKTLSYHELFRIWKMALFTAMRLSWEGYKNAMRVCPCVRSSGFYSGEEVDLWVRSDVNEVLGSHNLIVESPCHSVSTRYHYR